jgi:hypothetical protein
MEERTETLNKRLRCKGIAWLGRQDSNLGMAESKSAALPLGYAPLRWEAGRTIPAGWVLST